MQNARSCSEVQGAAWGFSGKKLRWSSASGLLRFDGSNLYQLKDSSDPYQTIQSQLQHAFREYFNKWEKQIWVLSNRELQGAPRVELHTSYISNVPDIPVALKFVFAPSRVQNGLGREEQRFFTERVCTPFQLTFKPHKSALWRQFVPVNQRESGAHFRFFDHNLNISTQQR